jgi:hypothetical protein
MGGVRKVGSVGPQGGRARAGVEVDRRAGGHGVSASVDEGRRQSSKGAGVLLVFMVSLDFVVVIIIIVLVIGELAFTRP